MISFTSKDTDKQLIIGGVANLDPTANTEFGVVGPFPRYSITREELTTEDGTYINSKFSITVTGTATIKHSDSQDMLKKGERQSRVQGEALILAQLNRNQWPMHGNGVLEIAPYGGIQDNIIIYKDARITSIELPEQNESAGVQNQEYTIQFEAYEDTSVVKNSNNPAGSDEPITTPTYKLSSVAESWELVPLDSRFVYKDDKLAGAAVEADALAVPPIEAEDAAETPYKTFTLTHSLSATGLKKMKGDSVTSSGLADNGESWRQAAEYIGERLQKVGDPLTAIGFNTLNVPITKNDPAEAQVSNQFNPGKMDSDDTNLRYNLSDATRTNPDFNPDAPASEENPATLPNGVYKAYDHVRTVSSDVSAGSYSVTDTWVVAYKNLDSDENDRSATVDIEISIEGAVTDNIVVTLSGTVTGLDTAHATAQQHNKYANAKAAYYKLAKSFKAAADAAYNDFIAIDPDSDSGAALPPRDDLDSWINPQGALPKTLKSAEFAKTLGINEPAGTINFSVSYDDAIISDPSVVNESLQVDDNGGTQVVAIIGVLLRAEGPVIQDMGTITEKTRTVTYTAKINRANRITKPTFAEGLVDQYAPFAITVPNPDYDPVTNPNVPTTIPGPNADKQWVQIKSESWNRDTGDYTFSKEWVYN